MYSVRECSGKARTTPAPASNPAGAPVSGSVFRCQRVAATFGGKGAGLRVQGLGSLADRLPTRLAREGSGLQGVFFFFITLESRVE